MCTFARLNRSQLRALGIEIAQQPSKKALMGPLMEGVKTWADSFDWVSAPPKALPAPTAEAPAAEPDIDQFEGLPLAQAADEPIEEPSSAPSMPRDPRAKRACRSAL